MQSWIQKVSLFAALSLSVFPHAALAEEMMDKEMPKKEIGIEQEQQKRAAPLCQFAFVPPGGAVIPGTVPPLKVGVNTNQGCTVKFNPPPITVPAGAFNPQCLSLPAGGANSIVVTCNGVPNPVNPPVSALGLSFTCDCPPGVGLGANNKTETYLF